MENGIMMPPGDGESSPHKPVFLESMEVITSPATATTATADHQATTPPTTTEPMRPVIPGTMALNRLASQNPRTPKPQKVLQSVYKIGQFKANLEMQYLIMQSFMAGLYKSVGCHTFVTLGGGVLGAVFFPAGLIAIVLTSAELFTGDLLILVVCYLGGKVPGHSLIRNLTVSWIFNFCGTLLWAALIAYGSGAVEDKGQVEFAIQLAEDKTTQPWGHVLAKGIGANFLVCLALWQAMTADDVASKILAIWFPIVPFVINGLEHVVANMFFIPLGMMYGADVTIWDMIWRNLIPSTIGNILGGAFGIGLTYWFLFDANAKEANLLHKMQVDLQLSYGLTRHYKKHMRRNSSSSSSDDEKDEPQT